MAEQIEQAARTAGRTFNISLAELAGANAGQRNDLLALNQAVYRVPDGTLYTSTGSQLVLAQGLPVTAQANLTGGIELTAGGNTLAIPKTSPSPTNAFYGGIGEQVLFDLSSSVDPTGTAARISDGSVSCPDPSFPFNILQIGSGGIIDSALASTVSLATVESIGFWARAFRTSDSNKFTAAKILLSDTTTGYTNFGTLSFVVRADGKWRYHVAPILGFSSSPTRFGTVAGRLRFREDDGVATTGRVLMAGGDRLQIGAIRINPKGKTAMFVRFDDGLDNLYSAKKAVVASSYLGSSGVSIPAGTYSFLELLNYFGFKGNCFVVTDEIGKPGFETWAGLKALQANGWSICVQAGANPVSETGDGARLLGPVGYNLHPTPGDITGVASSVFTVAGGRPDSIGGTAGSVALGGIQSFPVQVLGTVPAPLVSGGTYYALRRGVRTFSLHAIPVGLSPQDDNAGLVVITGTVTSGMTVRYAGSAPDASAILADYQKAQNELTANGLTGVKHLALNQGGYDVFVEDAIMSAGFKSVQTTQTRPAFVQSIAGMVSSTVTNTTLAPATNGRAGTSLSGAFSVLTIAQTDGALTELNLRQFVNDCVKYGSVGANYHHNTNNIPQLLAYLDQCKVFQDVGLLEVLTVEQQQARLDAAVSNPTLI